jgi:hypothetical protein
MGRIFRTHGDMRNEHNILVYSLDGRDHLEDEGVDGMIMLKWMMCDDVD